MQKHKAHNSLFPFLLANQLEKNNGVNKYNLCFSYCLNDTHTALIVADKLQALICRQAYLRQTFTLENNSPIGWIHDTLPAEVQTHTIALKELNNLEHRLTTEPFDIANQSSIRLHIILFTDASQTIVLFSIHHVLMDGISLDYFISDLNELISNREIPEQDAKSYIKQINKEPLLKTEDNNPQLPAYLKSIQDITNDINFFDDKTSSHVSYYHEKMPSVINNKLLTLSNKFNLSVFNLLLLAWSIFNAKMNNQDHNLVFFPVNIRHDKSILGCFINSIIFPLNTIKKETYATLIHSMRDKLSLLKYVSQFSLCHHINLNNLSNFGSSPLAKPKNLVINNQSIESKGYAQIANAGISIKYREYQNELYFTADILSGIIPDFVASSLLLRFFNYLNTLLDNFDTPLSEIGLTFSEEKKQILYEFNQTKNPFPKNETLIDLFEEQVQKTPNAIAFVFENITFTYSELNNKSNQLAHYLTYHYQVKPDDFIALLLDRNEYTIIAILAILKAGGTYVPLDISYPQERIDFILEDTAANMLIINEHRLDSFLNEQDEDSFYKHCKLIVIDSNVTENILKQFSKNNIITANTGENLAYVIYTSGTTGKPKGVMIEHKNVMNTLRDLFYLYQRDNQHIPVKSTAFTSYAFDVSVSEFFVPLLQGDELHLLSNTLRKNILLTSKYINDNQINYVYLPPVLLANLPRIKYPSLKAIIYAGEPCDAETALYWSDKIKLYNYYGPTETSIYATGLQIQKKEVHLIGKPISNTTAYILNTDKIPQPIGITGELYIGGAGVAKGYLNQRELTEERFILNPFQTQEELINNKNSRLYKTGDLARWHPDGNIEYLGRNDFQIKIRGYRIELGEIEAALLNYQGIKQAIVLLHNHTNSDDKKIIHDFLVGYYVADERINDVRIQEYLSLHLPDYMQPRALIYLPFLPVTPNGKLDRQALPIPELTHNNYIPPTNRKETLICAAFAKVLGLSKVGIEDNFFNLGGNSILAISLVAALQNNFNINVSDIFHLKTPRKIAKDILFIKNNLINNLEKICPNYELKTAKIYEDTPFHYKLNHYYATASQVDKLELLPISNILLTGATGFLGSNLLNTLLTTTNYSVFLLVRAQSDAEAFERVNSKYYYYFGEILNHLHNQRLFIYAGELGQMDLGISKDTYQLLVNQIDCIIHSAALTKHYGDYDTFYLANVQTTQNLLELSKLTKLKSFHYISTSSVLNEGYIPNCDYYVFTEDDDGDNLKERSNIYVRTKYEGERIAIRYRKHGINSSIYRVGNLAFIAKNHRVQENIDDNAFYTRLKSFIDLNIIAKDISTEEISPADLTAQAILKLVPIKQLSNKTFHVFNPELTDLAEILSNNKFFNVELVTLRYFISTIINILNNEEYNQTIELFLLHMHWLNEPHPYHTRIKILQNRTQCILELLGFEWNSVTYDDIAKIVQGK